jgi:hypothetical protein
MLRSVVVGAFYKDLVNTDYETAFAIYHRRFSTNTTPKWPLAQPMRILGHNGEQQTAPTAVGTNMLLFQQLLWGCFSPPPPSFLIRVCIKAF